MNHHPTFLPSTPIDGVQVAAFATANQTNFVHLNQNLGLSLGMVQFGYIQHHYRTIEKKNPSFGELILLDTLIQNTPVAQKISCGELYCNSDILMETWGHIMATNREVCGETAPLTPMELLALPQKILRHRGLLSSRDILPPITHAHNLTQAKKGLLPTFDITADGSDTSRWLWCPSTPPQPTHTQIPPATPKNGDVLIFIPNAELSAILSLLEHHPLHNGVIDYSLHKASVMQAALALCSEAGLQIQLDNFLYSATAPNQSRIRMYTQMCETPCADNKCHVVVRTSQNTEIPLLSVLVGHGFPAYRLGYITRDARLTIMDKGFCVVRLMTSFVSSVAYPTLHTYVLPDPSPVAETQASISHPTRTYLPSQGLLLSEVSIRHEEDSTDGFTATLRGGLLALGDLACAGVPYSYVQLSPVISYTGDVKNPLLLTTLMGLYRLSCELGIPMVHPHIDIIPAEGQPPRLHLSLCAYAPVVDPDLMAQLPQNVFDTPHLSLTLLAPPTQDVFDFSHVRGLLSYVAELVQKNPTNPQLHTLICLHGTGIEAWQTHCQSITAQFFGSQKDLLAAPHLLGFMTASPAPLNGYHVGDTCDGTAQSAPLPPNPTHNITNLPYPTIADILQKETQRRKEKQAMEQIKAFQPLSQRPRPVILDTDIGPDCDDVGALVTLIHYAKQYNFPIMGVCNCTSMRAGNGVIDAVCRRCGIDTPPMGQWSGAEFMNNPEYHKYNDAVAERFSEGYRNGTLAITDEVTFYRTLLANAKDGEVMVISIGMFNNLAALLKSPADEISPLTGAELVKAKVYALVSMAAILPEGRECNVLCDYVSAKEVFDNWPTPIYFSDFYIGLSVKTGYSHITDTDAIHADPLVMSYHYYTKDWQVHGENASYDLTAVQFAALGVGELYGLCDTPGRLEFYAAIPDQPDLVDATRFVPDPMGNRIFMTKKVDDEVIAQSLNDILHNI